MDFSTFRHIYVQHNSTTEQTLVQDGEPGNMEQDSSWENWRKILLQRRRKILVRAEDKLTSEKMEHLVQLRERNGQTSSPWQLLQIKIKIKLVPEEAPCMTLIKREFQHRSWFRKYTKLINGLETNRISKIAGRTLLGVLGIRTNIYV